MTRALSSGAGMPALAFVAVMLLAATAMRVGLVSDDAVRLWAGAITAGSGEIPIGRIVAAYPSIPFLSTTLVALITPDWTPAPVLVAAAVFALMIGSGLSGFAMSDCRSGPRALPRSLIGSHPILLRAVIGGPADVFLAVFLFMTGSALYDLRAHSTASEVMAVAFRCSRSPSPIRWVRRSTLRGRAVLGVRGAPRAGRELCR